MMMASIWLSLGQAFNFLPSVSYSFKAGRPGTFPSPVNTMGP